MLRPRRLLLISNGHGEDAEASFIARAIREAGLGIDMRAIAMVGEGKAYRDAGVALAGPVFVPPSNGFSYMDRSLLWADIRAGLIGATLGQWRAIRREARNCDLVLGIGDEYCQLLAWSSGRPFVSYIAPLSAHYEGHLNLDLMLLAAMRSRMGARVAYRDSSACMRCASSCWACATEISSKCRVSPGRLWPIWGRSTVATWPILG